MHRYLSQLTTDQRAHLAWRLDHLTYVGMLTASRVARGDFGDLDLVTIFRRAGCSTRAAVLHARRVVRYSPTGVDMDITTDRADELYEMAEGRRPIPEDLSDEERRHIDLTKQVLQTLDQCWDGSGPTLRCGHRVGMKIYGRFRNWCAVCGKDA